MLVLAGCFRFMRVSDSMEALEIIAFLVGLAILLILTMLFCTLYREGCVPDMATRIGYEHADRL